MGYVKKTEARQTVELSEGYTAVIRQLRRPDQLALQAALFGDLKRREIVIQQGTQTRTEAQQLRDNEAWTTALLLHGIVSWTLDDDDGNPLPVNEETLQLLSSPDIGTLTKAIAALAFPKDAEAEDEPKSPLVNGAALQLLKR